MKRRTRKRRAPVAPKAAAPVVGPVRAPCKSDRRRKGGKNSPASANMAADQLSARAPAQAGGSRAASKAESSRRAYLAQDVKRLVRAIFARNDPVEIASQLLGKEGDATMAKIFQLLMEYLYGKPVQQYDAGGPYDDRRPFQIAAHIPRPRMPQAAAETASNPREDENDGHE